MIFQLIPSIHDYSSFQLSKMKNEDRMQLNIRKTINKIGTFRKYLVRNNNNIQTRKASDNKDSTIIRIARNAYLSSFRLMVVRNSHQLDLNHSHLRLLYHIVSCSVDISPSIIINLVPRSNEY